MFHCLKVAMIGRNLSAREEREPGKYNCKDFEVEGALAYDFLRTVEIIERGDKGSMKEESKKGAETRVPKGKPIL